MKIDRRRFIEIKSDKKVDRQIITINENGVIGICFPGNAGRAEEKCIFAAYQRRQQTAPFRCPAGSGTVIRNDEPITAKYLIQMIDERVRSFSYELQDDMGTSGKGVAWRLADTAFFTGQEKRAAGEIERKGTITEVDEG